MEATLVPKKTHELKPRTKSPLYTRSGDTGTTSLAGGQRVSKSSAIIKAIGAVEELNAHIGSAREVCYISKTSLEFYLEAIQSELFMIAMSLAAPPGSSASEQMDNSKFDQYAIEALEEWIDGFDVGLPKLKDALVPSGGRCAASFHVCRAICRRAETIVAKLVQRGEARPEILRYLNRLGDFLFVAARFCAHIEGREELVCKDRRLFKNESRASP